MPTDSMADRLSPGDTVRITSNGDQFGRIATAIRQGDHGKWFCQVVDDEGRQYTRWLHQADLETMSEDVRRNVSEGYGNVHSAARHQHVNA
jgi:hypothetical protein